MSRMRIEPGDTVLVYVPFHQSQEQRDRLHTDLSAGFPDGVRVLVLPYGIKIEATIGVPPKRP